MRHIHGFDEECLAVWVPPHLLLWISPGVMVRVTFAGSAFGLKMSSPSALWWSPVDAVPFWKDMIMLSLYDLVGHIPSQ